MQARTQIDALTQRPSGKRFLKKNHQRTRGKCRADTMPTTEQAKDLDDEVAHNAAVANVHAWAKRVEDAGDAHLHAFLVLVRVAHGLRDALALVVARPRAKRVHVAPVRLRLRVHLYTE
jgi:hypothetical protein